MRKSDKMAALLRRVVLFAAAGLVLFLALPAALPARAQTEGAAIERAVIEIADGIYRTRENRHFGLLVETRDSMVVFDPLNADFAKWLDQEIASRFNKPVSYVIYSHNHADHTSGGEVFAHHNPRYVSHELARESHLRAGVKTRPADVTFSENYTLRPGGRVIELRYHGTNDGRGSISLLVPDQKVLSVIDWLVIGRLPFRELNRYDVEGMIRSLKEIDALDWVLAAPGHADIGGKEDARVLLRYLETLRDATMAEILAGSPMDAAVATIRARLAGVPEFRALKQFDAWVEENIRGVHFQLSSTEGFADQVLPDPAYAARR